MTYLVQRKDRSHILAYDGIEPLTGRVRRRWIPVGHDPRRSRKRTRRAGRFGDVQVDAHFAAARLVPRGIT